MGLTHSFVSEIADGDDDSVVRPSDWNAEHVIDAEQITPDANTKILTLDTENEDELSYATVGDIASLSPSVGILASPRTVPDFKDEFEGATLDPMWTQSNAPAVQSFDDKIRSAIWMQHAGSSSDFVISADYANAGDFSLTLCAMVRMSSNFHNLAMNIQDSDGSNSVGIQLIHDGAGKLRSTRVVSGGFSQLNITTPTFTNVAHVLMHIQRDSGNWTWWYSFDGIQWTSLTGSTSFSFTVAKINISGGVAGSSTRTWSVLHWIRENWITL